MEARLLAIVSNNILVPNTEELLNWCRNYLIVDNPDYKKKKKMGLYTMGTPSHLYLFEIIGQNLVIPFGCLQVLHNTFKDKIEWRPSFQDNKLDLDFKSKIKLYEYQKKTVEAILQKKNGIVVMPCGSGKTQTALEAVARIGRRTLWLTHTQDLLNQSMVRAKAVFDIDESNYGTITAGKVNIGEAITFATVQTMAKIDLQRYQNIWDVIIVDECHHCCGSPTRVTQFYKVVSSLSARYKIGLTATPTRSDGMDIAMYALLGSIIHEVPREEEEVKQKTCPIHVIKMDTEYFPHYDSIIRGDGTIDYIALVNDLIHDEDRYLKVFDIIKTCKSSILILANRVEYIQKLNADFNEHCGKSVCISTLKQNKEAKEARKKILKDLNEGRLDAVFATYQLAKEGLDVPNLRYVVFATPEKDRTTIIQSAGRVGRNADGKEKGIVIDLVDGFSMYKNWSKERDTSYRKINAEIIY